MLSAYSGRGKLEAKENEKEAWLQSPRVVKLSLTQPWQDSSEKKSGQTPRGCHSQNPSLSGGRTALKPALAGALPAEVVRLGPAAQPRRVAVRLAGLH